MLDLLTMRAAFGPLLDPLPIDPTAEVVVEELEGLSITSLVARRGRETALVERLNDALGIALLPGPHRARGEGVDLMGVAPATWLAIAPPDASHGLARMAATLGGLASVCDQSGGYGVLRLTGPRARDLLQAGIFIDLAEPAFGSDAVIVSAIGHMGIMLWRCATAEGFEIATHRSEAASFAHWLLSSATAAGISLSRAPPIR